MASKNISTNIKNPYLRNNKIRTKLLLFIDNEIKSKIKQNHKNLKFNCENGTQVRISFEETFTQKQTNKYVFNNLYKSVSTIEDSSNRFNKKLYKTQRTYNHSQTLPKKYNCPNVLLKDDIIFHNKIYSIKNLSRQSSTFLILPNRKYASEYLKILCNNLKICKNDKKRVKQCESINAKSKLFNLSKEKKSTIKSNRIKIPKSQKNNLDKLYICSLFRKPKKENSVINSKFRDREKLSNSILIKLKSNE